MNREMLYLNRSDIEQAGGNHSQVYVDALTEALTAHAHNDFVQPLKPYLRQILKMDTSQIELLQCQVISVVNTQFQVLSG